MATEYKLSYTAEEINEKLGQIGNDKAIIDVTELPTENINEGSFYRLTTGSLVFNQYEQETFNIHCIEQLPEVGRPATNLDQSEGNVYYNYTNGNAYGYVDDMLAMGVGVPTGWYEASVLLGALGYGYSGVITHINDDPCDDTFRILLKYEFYVYKDGWMNVPFGYEMIPKFDIHWDGNTDGHFMLDMSMLGYPQGTYFVKVSDEILTQELVLGGTINYDRQGIAGAYSISEESIDASTFAGAINIDNWVVSVHSANDLSVALGLPAGYITNGTYFLYVVDTQYVTRIVAPTRVTKIDEKFLPTMDVDIWGSLPKPTIADNGKILQVVNGEAAWVGVNIAEEASF